ncbi:hypothetical protein LUZ63_008496 [Rhynchospora breviuscula]|uniref:Ribosomal protein/NADH dehydrogenase domain-containing protein n=1 Tax=Rhynchospora breviuscula TaxID=2022672 RepID=A0A9Q0CTN9_9POAL|nr:hypothetical protein LUZ63_008496 [Rhynchospora breviuscula]
MMFYIIFFVIYSSTSMFTGLIFISMPVFGLNKVPSKFFQVPTSLRRSEHTKPFRLSLSLSLSQTASMAWRGNLSKSIKELRFLFCQTSPASSHTRDFVLKNYTDLKTKNPKLPILIRECSGVQPQVWARYGTHSIVPIFLHLIQSFASLEEISLRELVVLVGIFHWNFSKMKFISHIFCNTVIWANILLVLWVGSADTYFRWKKTFQNEIQLKRILQSCTWGMILLYHLCIFVGLFGS